MYLNPNEYHFAGEEMIPSPALIYYTDVITENTLTAIRLAGNADRLWPHVKTHKQADMIREQLSLGIRRFKCATIAEAEMCAACGADTVLLAYPLVGPNVARFLKLRDLYPAVRFLALADDLDVLEAIGRAAGWTPVKVMIDVNTGMDRTGVSFRDLPAFTDKAMDIAGIEVTGFHCYDGERHEKDVSSRKFESLVSESALAQALTALEDRLPEPEIIFGGSPSFPCHAEGMAASYLSPGTVFVYDAGYSEQFPDLPFTAGAAVLTRVVSHPSDGYFTTDCGVKGVTNDQGRPGILPEYPEAELLFQSEEHAVWRMRTDAKAKRPAIGTVLYLIPWHICPTTALYDEVVTVSEGKCTGTRPVTARGRKITV